MELSRGLKHSLVLRDRENSFHIMVSNRPMSARAMRSGSKVIPSQVVMAVEYEDAEWKRIFRGTPRYYLYTVHTSLLYLESDSLAAQLYLTWCYACGRMYRQAARAAALCKCDRKLAEEEEWVLNLFLQSPKAPDFQGIEWKLVAGLASSGTPLPFEQGVGGVDNRRLPVEQWPLPAELRTLLLLGREPESSQSFKIPPPKNKWGIPEDVPLELDAGQAHLMDCWPSHEQGHVGLANPHPPARMTTVGALTGSGNHTTHAWHEVRELSAALVNEVHQQYDTTLAQLDEPVLLEFEKKPEHLSASDHECTKQRELEKHRKQKGTLHGISALTYKRPPLSGHLGPAYTGVRFTFTRTRNPSRPLGLSALRLRRWFGGELISVAGEGALPKGSPTISTADALLVPAAKGSLRVRTGLRLMRPLKHNGQILPVKFFTEPNRLHLHSGKPDQVNVVVLPDDLAAAGLSLSGISFAYRYGIEHSKHQSQQSTGTPYFEVVLVELDTGADESNDDLRSHVLYRSPEGDAERYGLDR
jgi:hypothetical protein